MCVGSCGGGGAGGGRAAPHQACIGCPLGRHTGLLLIAHRCPLFEAARARPAVAASGRRGQGAAGSAAQPPLHVPACLLRQPVWPPGSYACLPPGPCPQLQVPRQGAADQRGKDQGLVSAGGGCAGWPGAGVDMRAIAGVARGWRRRRRAVAPHASVTLPSPQAAQRLRARGSPPGWLAGAHMPLPLLHYGAGRTTPMWRLPTWRGATWCTGGQGCLNTVNPTPFANPAAAAAEAPATRACTHLRPHHRCTHTTRPTFPAATLATPTSSPLTVPPWQSAVPARTRPPTASSPSPPSATPAATGPRRTICEMVVVVVVVVCVCVCVCAAIGKGSRRVERPPHQRSHTPTLRSTALHHATSPAALAASHHINPARPGPCPAVTTSCTAATRRRALAATRPAPSTSTRWGSLYRTRVPLAAACTASAACFQWRLAVYNRVSEKRGMA